MVSSLVSKHFNILLPLFRFPATLGFNGELIKTLQPDQSPKVVQLLLFRYSQLIYKC